MKKFILLLALSSQSFAAKWDNNNNPNYFEQILGSELVINLYELPLEGRLDDDRMGWSDTYWPSNRGGIAYRWNHPDPTPFRYRLHTKEELLKMSHDQLARLSPAELYDISQGDYNYTLTKKTLSMFSANALWWEGICHGWAQAASNYPEPAKVVIKNPHGIKVPFGSSDVKGLLSMYDAYNANGAYARVGERCSVRGKIPGEESARDGYVTMPAPEEAARPECEDVNAGAFHIILTNMIGVHSMGFVADVDRFNDVWNQPITSYSTAVKEEIRPTEEEKSAGVARKLRLTTVMSYGEELQFFNPEAFARGDKNFVSKEPVTRTAHQAFRAKNYEYFLELNDRNEIIGGEWISDTRPDFLWAKKRDKKFVDDQLPLSGLNVIYRPTRL